MYQKQWKNVIVKLVMSLMIFTHLTTLANADSCQPVVKKCNEALTLCDQTIEEKNKTIELAGDAIKACVQHGTQVQLQLNQAKDELNKWYHNPIYVGILGIVAGAVAGKLLLK